MVADINPINSGLWYSWGPHKPTFTSRLAMKFQERAKCRVMAMAMSYNWLFHWDEKHSINGPLLVRI